MKPIPPGKKGKGLRMLSKSVRNNMGYMKNGGYNYLVSPRKEEAGALDMPRRAYGGTYKKK